jgi:hypothetical protein
MDQHKIANFLRDHPTESFPPYLQLDVSQARAIRDSIMQAVESREIDGLGLVKRVHALSVEAGAVTAGDGQFSLLERLRELRVASHEKVYLNWYRFDRIDQIGLSDLDRYFFDIWYPDSDDSMKWVLSIAHHGNVRLFTKRKTRNGWLPVETKARVRVKGDGSL